MRYNKFITVNNKNIKFSYRDFNFSTSVEKIESLSIIKMGSNNVLIKFLLADNYKVYYLRIKTRDNNVHLKRIRYKDRKTLAREITKIMDYTFENRIKQ